MGKEPFRDAVRPLLADDLCSKQGWKEEGGDRIKLVVFLTRALGSILGVLPDSQTSHMQS